MSPTAEDFEREVPGIPKGLAERVRAVLQETTAKDVEGYVVIYLRKGDWAPALFGMVEKDGEWYELQPEHMLQIMQEIVKP